MIDGQQPLFNLHVESSQKLISRIESQSASASTSHDMEDEDEHSE